MVKYVRNFIQFLYEQEIAADPATGAPVEPAADTGTATPPPEVHNKINFTFIRIRRDGKSFFVNQEKSFPYYSIDEDKLKEWTKKYVTDPNKVEDFVNIIKAKGSIKIKPEKKYINVFKHQVESGDIGKNEGVIFVEFDKKGEAFTDKLDVNFVFYESNGK